MSDLKERRKKVYLIRLVWFLFWQLLNKVDGVYVPDLTQIFLAIENDYMPW